MNGTYFATHEQLKDLLESNKKLEIQLTNLQSEKYDITPKDIPYKGVSDPLFGCDVRYIKLLTRNTQLKYEIDRLT